MNTLFYTEKPQYSTFTGLYMSGVFIDNPRLLTTISLLYDKVYLPNQLEFVIEFSKKYKFTNYKNDGEIKVSLSSNESDYLDGLTIKQRETAIQYLEMVGKFSIYYKELFGEVLISDFFPDNKILEIVDTQLIKQGAQGEKNTYSVSFQMEPITFTIDENNRTMEVLESGAIPIFGEQQLLHSMHADKYTAKFLSSLLSMRAIDVVLPPIKSAKPEVILEARYNLRDYLPLFWSEMLRLTQHFKNSLSYEASIDEVMFEANDYVDCNIRPLLIEINSKMIHERKSRFRDIILPSEKDSIQLSIGSPSLITNSQIINMGLPMNHRLSNNEENTGLSFLLNMSKYIPNI